MWETGVTVVRIRLRWKCLEKFVVVRTLVDCEGGYISGVRRSDELAEGSCVKGIINERSYSVLIILCSLRHIRHDPLRHIERVRRR